MAPSVFFVYYFHNRRIARRDERYYQRFQHRGKQPVAAADIADRFGIKEMLTDQSKDHDFIASFLYYFGVPTLEGERPDGKLELRVPNLVVRGLYVVDSDSKNRRT